MLEEEWWKAFTLKENSFALLELCLNTVNIMQNQYFQQNNKSKELQLKDKYQSNSRYYYSDNCVLEWWSTETLGKND